MAGTNTKLDSQVLYHALLGINGEDVYGKEQAGCGRGGEGREMNWKEEVMDVEEEEQIKEGEEVMNVEEEGEVMDAEEEAEPMEEEEELMEV